MFVMEIVSMSPHRELCSLQKSKYAATYKAPFSKSVFDTLPNSSYDVQAISAVVTLMKGRSNRVNSLVHFMPEIWTASLAPGRSCGIR